MSSASTLLRRALEALESTLQDHKGQIASMLAEVRELAASAIEEEVHVALATRTDKVVPPESVTPVTPTDDEIAKQRAANIALATHAAATAAGAPPSGQPYVLLDGKMVPLSGAPAVAHVASPVPPIVEVKAGTPAPKVDHDAIRAMNPALFPRNPGQ